MRTLQTQMRVRRALRVEAEYQRRLYAEGPSPDLARASAARLLQVLRDVRAAWSQESAGTDLAGNEGLPATWTWTITEQRDGFPAPRVPRRGLM